MQTQVLTRIIILLALVGGSAYGNEWAFSGVMPSGHRGAVKAIVHRGDTILSAGEDGFLQIWNARSGQAAQRFQISPYQIIAMAERPGKDEISLIESNGMGLYRISAWNYKERRQIFSLHMRDSLGSISYSMGGNFIIAGRSGLTSSVGLVLINSNSGAVLQSPSSLTGAVSLAVTGRSERNMLSYSASGSLSYWDLESGNETSHFDTPANLSSPVLFSNNRYLAGINAQGLQVINAVSGEVLAQEETIPAASLLCAAGDELICLVQTQETQLYRYTIDRNGQMIRAGNFSVGSGASEGIGRFTSIASNGGARGTIALGTDDGGLVLSGMNGQPRTLSTKGRTGITEAEISGATIAFFTENGMMGFIPLDYSRLSARRSLQLEQNREAYNRITAFNEENSGEQFVFWQDKNTRTAPLVRSPNPRGNKTSLDDISFRAPIRSVDSFDGKILFLDSTGNISITAPLDANKSRPFTFFSVGLMDAAFVDHERIIIGRSAVSGNTPFMIINIKTGETVPLPYPTQAGVILHRGASGSIYAAETDGTKTSIIHFEPTIVSGSSNIVDFQGEDTHFFIAESPSGIASTIGGEEAAIYSAGNVQKLDRSGGLPHKLIDGGSWLVSLDSDGSICWHDSHDGKLLAIFRLHPDGWTLQTARTTITGGL